MILEVIYAFISTLGFGILFNVRNNNLIFSAIGGALGWFFYSLLLKYNQSAMTAIFIASIVISIYSEIMSRVLKNPVTLFLICALIPLVPGSGMYYTIYEAVQGDIMSSLNKGIEALSLAGAIAVGIILVSSLSRLIQKVRSLRNEKRRLKTNQL